MSAPSGDLEQPSSQRTKVGLDPALHQPVSDQRTRRARSLSGRDLVATVVAGATFAGVAVPLALTAFPGVSAPLVGALVMAYAVASRVEFEIGSGLAVPTQLVLVPALFLLPAGIVPLCVAAGFMLGSVPDIVSRRSTPARALVPAISAWHAVGPAAVLVLAGVGPVEWARWPIYLAALAAQFALDLVSTATRRWLLFGLSRRTHLREMSQVWLVDAALAPAGLLAAAAGRTQPYVALLVLPLAGLLAVFARERKARFDHAIELSQAYRGTAFLLGDLIEADDAYTGSHSRDVLDLTLVVADEFGLSPRDRRDAEFVALLHDVGKVHVPNEIINKPGPLTVEERLIVNRHTVDGERMLERIGGVLGNVGRVVRSCHERWDGGGYPDGLVGDATPLLARIVCCVDAFDAMTTHRSYRSALSYDDALAEITRMSGTQFDPLVVDALHRVVERGQGGDQPQSTSLARPGADGADLRGEHASGGEARSRAA